MSPRPLVRAAVGAALALALSSCAPTPEAEPHREPPCPIPQGPVAVAVSVRANSPAADPLPAGVGDVVENVLGRTSTGPAGPVVTLIGIDGRPFVVGSREFRSTAGNDRALDDDRRAFLASLQDGAAKARATTAEADVLGALALAARAARTGGGPGTVVLVDSGLQTVSPLDYREAGLLRADPGELAGYLRHGGAVPDLSGLTVLLYGIGDTAAPQESLDPAARARLAEQWAAIVDAGAPACSAVVAEPRTEPAPSDVPPVAPVRIDRMPTIQPTTEQPIRLPDDGEVGFRPGEAEFRDPQRAQAALAPIARWLGDGPRRRLQVTGTTARWGGDDYQLDLSRRRADAVREALRAQGVDPARIATTGVGSRFAGYVDDLADDGSLLPGPAARNRSVVVELQP